MNRASRRRLANRVAKVKGVYSARMARALKKVFSAQMREVLALTHQDPTNILPRAEVKIDSHKARLEKIYTFYYSKIMFEKGAIRRARKASFIPYEQGVNEFAKKQAAKRVKQISRSTRDKIRRTVRAGIELGMTPEELAGVIQDTAPRIFSAKRARAIAETEMHNAYEEGTRLEAEQSDAPMVKTWTSIIDSNSRLGHAEMDGIQVPQNGYFTVPLYDHNGERVGEHEMVGPGDSNAPASQVINCRCTAIYEEVA